LSQIAEILAGTKVVVTDARGRDLQKRAITPVVQGDNFPVVWVCREAEWTAAKAEGRDPEGLPWPAEDVRLA
jgi:hypothetical protein